MGVLGAAESMSSAQRPSCRDSPAGSPGHHGQARVVLSTFPQGPSFGARPSWQPLRAAVPAPAPCSLRARNPPSHPSGLTAASLRLWVAGTPHRAWGFSPNGPGLLHLPGQGSERAGLRFHPKFYFRFSVGVLGASWRLQGRWRGPHLPAPGSFLQGPVPGFPAQRGAHSRSASPGAPHRTCLGPEREGVGGRGQGRGGLQGDKVRTRSQMALEDTGPARAPGGLQPFIGAHSPSLAGAGCSRGLELGAVAALNLGRPCALLAPLRCFPLTRWEGPGHWPPGFHLPHLRCRLGNSGVRLRSPGAPSSLCSRQPRAVLGPAAADPRGRGLLGGTCQHPEGSPHPRLPGRHSHCETSRSHFLS